MLCRKCKREVAGGNRFCPYCGEPMGQMSSSFSENRSAQYDGQYQYPIINLLVAIIAFIWGARWMFTAIDSVLTTQDTFYYVLHDTTDSLIVFLNAGLGILMAVVCVQMGLAFLGKKSKNISNVIFQKNGRSMEVTVGQEMFGKGLGLCCCGMCCWIESIIPFMPPNESFSNMSKSSIIVGIIGLLVGAYRQKEEQKMREMRNHAGQADSEFSKIEREKYCSYCGSANSQNAKFCLKCGRTFPNVEGSFDGNNGEGR